jgi:hypothetical protein
VRPPFGSIGIANIAALTSADYTAQGVGTGRLIPATKLIAQQSYCLRCGNFFRWFPVWWPQLFCYSLCWISAPTSARLSSALATLVGVQRPDYELALLVDFGRAQFDEIYYFILVDGPGSLLAFGVTVVLLARPITRRRVSRLGT